VIDMTQQQDKVIERLAKYAGACHNRNNDVAAKSVNTVISSVTALTEQFNRLSDHSVETQEALDSLKEAITGGVSANVHNTLSKSFLSVLLNKVKSNVDISAVVNPAIETLQFQDRIRQNIENLNKITEIWLHTHNEIAANKNSFSEEERNAFGQKLIDAMVMTEEREVIQKYFPDIEGSESDDDEILFF
jgi:hypothetical protein